MKRPDMRPYFKAQIDRHVNGLSATSRTPLMPRGVQRVVGGVTQRLIVVTMDDGTVWHWSGGQYAARKVNGCYAPLMPMPKPFKEAS